MSLSIWQILLVVVLFILLFGRGRIPALMTDLAAGIKSFKQGMTESEPAAAAVTPVQQVQQVQPAQPSLESTQAEPATVHTTAQQRSL